MLKDVVRYIKSIRVRIKDIVPEEELNGIMLEVTNVICDNWINEDDYRLTKLQVMSLVRKHIAKKYHRN
jgi:hypothetical protein